MISRYSLAIRVLALALPVVEVASQSYTWSQLQPASSPGARWRHAMAYDSAREQVVVFGGGASGTWEWNGIDWILRASSSGPGGRDFPAMAYDAARNRVVLFGGDDNSPGYLGDTWEWDGTSWLQLTPATSPPARRRHAVIGARDGGSDGGCGGAVCLGDGL